MVKVRGWMSFLFLALPSASLAAAGGSDLDTLREEVRQLRQAQEAMARDLEQIRTAINDLTRPRPPTAAATSSGGTELDLTGRPARGVSSAPVTMVAYVDYQDPASARYFEEIHPKLYQQYILPGKVRYVFKNLPNKNAHPGAFEVHEAALCAGDQRKYWEFHDLLLANPGAQERKDLEGHARRIGLDAATFAACIEGGGHAALIESDLSEGARGNVAVTPVFAFGRSVPDGSSLKVLRVVVGPQPLARFEESIEAVLGATR